MPASLPSRLRRLAALAGLSTALVSSFGPAAAANASATPFRGAQTHPFWSDVTDADAVHELDVLKAAGTNTVRVDLGWSSLESAGKGQYSPWLVQKVDSYVQAAADRGIKVIATFTTTPCWASSAPESLKQGCSADWWNRGVSAYPPTNANDYADAAAWVAQRWGAKLAALEVWNEPNQQGFLNSPDPAGAYAAILNAAYPRIKQAAPETTVLGGALADSDGAFLLQLYVHGIQGHFDGFSLHPYSWHNPTIENAQNRTYTFLNGVPWIHDILTLNGDGNRDLWLTEFGFSTCTDGNTDCVSQAQQGSYLKTQFELARGYGYVKAAIAYDLRNDAEAPDRLSSYGLLHRDFSPKGGFRGFQEAMAEQLAPGGPTVAPPGAHSQAGGDGGALVAVPVAPSPGRRTIPVSSAGVATVKIVCHARRRRGHQRCQGVVRVRARAAAVPATRAGAHRRSTPGLGSQRFTVAAGASTMVRVRLNSTVRRRGGASHARIVVAATTLQPNGGQTTAARVFSLGG